MMIILDEGTGAVTRTPDPPQQVDRAAVDRDTRILLAMLEAAAALAHAIQYACEEATDGWQVSEEAFQWAHHLAELHERVEGGLPWAS